MPRPRIPAQVHAHQLSNRVSVPVAAAFNFDAQQSVRGAHRQRCVSKPSGVQQLLNSTASAVLDSMLTVPAPVPGLLLLPLLPLLLPLAPLPKMLAPLLLPLPPLLLLPTPLLLPLAPLLLLFGPCCLCPACHFHTPLMPSNFAPGSNCRAAHPK